MKNSKCDLMEGTGHFQTSQQVHVEIQNIFFEQGVE